MVLEVASVGGDGVKTGWPTMDTIPMVGHASCSLPLPHHSSILLICLLASSTFLFQLPKFSFAITLYLNLVGLFFNGDITVSAFLGFRFKF